MGSKYVGKHFISDSGIEYQVLKNIGDKYIIKVVGVDDPITIGKRTLKENKLKKLAYQLGILIKESKYTTKSLAGKKWKDMLDRCNSITEISLVLDHTYKECTVVDEWQSLDNFGDWFYSQKGWDLKWQLDKDIIKRDNKVYCPEFCCLVPQEVNLFFRSQKNKPNGLPTGVLLQHGKGYRSMCKIDGKYTGRTFSNPEDAYNHYMAMKYEAALMLTAKWSGQLDERIIEGIQKHYKLD